jgi:3-oxoacyl-[acyl-carrier protein] reductase
MRSEQRHIGKVALILGGSRGIGAGIVERLAAEGAKVAFTYLSSPDQANALAAAIAKQQGEAIAIQADSGDASQVQAAIDETKSRFGQLDILVANAGIARLGPIDQFSLDDFDRMVAVNVRGVFTAIHYAAPHMSKGGRIVTIGSNAAVRVGFAGASIYAMTKSAVAGLVKGAAIDLAPRGITVNNVQPGPVATDMVKGLGDTASMLIPLIPLGRLGEPDDIAGLVSYLASEEAGFVTGASLTIDGGYSL